MTPERQLEIEQYAEVFRVPDIEKKKWRYAHRNGRGWFHFWYDSTPDVMSTSYPFGCHYRTAICCLLYGEPPRVILSQGRIWSVVQTYMSSGEAPCAWSEVIGADPAKTTCELCDARPGEKHGYIYLGDGLAEVVYASKELPDAKFR